MESDPSYGNFMLKLIWRLSGNLPCFLHKNSEQSPDSFYHKISRKSILHKSLRQITPFFQKTEFFKMTISNEVYLK